MREPKPIFVVRAAMARAVPRRAVSAGVLVIALELARTIHEVDAVGDAVSDDNAGRAERKANPGFPELASNVRSGRSPRRCVGH